ncbi:MAG TPA: LTA synthase family protein [Flavobacteriales bacterium]|nr:LTA synthase family protein [Flavobacteriales bacterium]
MPRYIALLLKLLLIGLLMGQAFRIALLLLHLDQWHDATRSDVLTALFDRGLIFDLYVTSWILIVPAIILGATHALGGTWRWAWASARWCFTIPFTLWLFLACADIPYFDYTNMRITDAALVTLHDPAQALKELATTPAYFGALLLFALATWLVARATGRVFQAPERHSEGSAARRWLLLPVPLALLFLGIRGSADPDQHPLIAQDAFFSDTPFLNQLGTNAAFSFMESLGQDHIQLMDDDQAIAEARAELGIEEARYASPLARMSRYEAPPRKLNIVLVLVESLSAQRLHRYGHPKQLMPSLEQLMDSSLTMDRFFSSGMHTANGIFSSLYGFPPIGAQHPMMHPSMTAQRFHGLPGALRDNGYRTCFISPGDPRFDNLNGFLPVNGFDALVSERDFPASDARNSWGVTDHALYRMALRKADQHHLNSEAPLFLTLLTVSSHKWSKAPEDITGFAPTSPDDDEAVYEYADRALAGFMAEARTRTWFDSTVFVFVGDHGQAFDPLHEVPIAYHHVPLVIHAPAVVAPGRLSGYGTQVDLPETILALLRMPHVNNTLGKDLIAGGHAAACFMADHRICAINDRGYLIRDGDVVRLYDHRARGTRNLSADQPALRDSLMQQAASMVQATHAIVTRKLAGVDGIRPIVP